MFRRRRSVSNPPQNSANTQTAASAAALAFLKKQSSDATLSKAAAAAALRSHTTTPEPVRSIQTKRMVRRDSTSSFGSPHGSVRQPFSSSLQRRGSNVSMTERSFRSPSPALSNAPPVPPLPNAPPLPQKSHRRTGSSEGTAIASNVGRPISSGPPPTGRHTATGSRNDMINFSRPMSPGPNPGSPVVRDAPKPRPASSLGFHSATARVSSGQKNTHALTAATVASRPAPAPAPSNQAAAVAAFKAGAPESLQRQPSKSAAPTEIRGRKEASRTAQTSEKPIPTPSEDQIRVFQTRAASLLARPRSEVYAPVEQPARARPASVSLKPSDAEQKVHVRSVSQPQQKTQQTRATQFSSSPHLDAVKHEPLPRAASPAKSALKSATPRTRSPAAPINGAMSDTSDARSIISEDGAEKKKKMSRVSFDERPAVVGQAAEPQTPVNDVLSPQYQKSTDWTSQDAMGPRPALPSFGSVRGRKTPTPDGPSPIKEEADPLVSKSREVSSDANVGAVLSRDFAASQSLAVPDISVLPATPNPDDGSQFQAPTPDMDAVLSAEDVADVKQSHPKDVPTSATPEQTLGYDSDDTAELYEDATDEPQDAGGYASLDAILESPQAESAPPLDVAPVVQEKIADGPVDTQEWEQVRAYWSGLSIQKRQQLEAEAAELRDSKTETKTAAPTTDEPLPPWPDTQYQTASPTHSRSGSEPHFPSSLRADKGMRSSLRDRPVSQQIPKSALKTPASPATKTVKPPSKPATAPQIAVPKPAAKSKPILSRTLSNESSNSDSSFKRRRRNSVASADGRVGMRRTMRGERPQSMVAPAKTNRASLRSPSPTRSRRGGQESEKGSIFGFGKSKTKPASSGGFKSRFADSSDEDEGAPTKFRSRFADSDDDEPTLRPVRGIPRAGRASGDSTDLSDSEAEAPAPVAALTTANLKAQEASQNANGQGGTKLHAGTMRSQAPASPSQKSRRGIFGLGRKKGTAPETLAQPAAQPRQPADAASVAPSTTSNMPKTLRAGAQTPDNSRKFFRRLSSSQPGSPMYNGKEDFPFPPPPIPDSFVNDAATDRPATSDGVSARRLSLLRPPLGSKRDSAMTAPAADRPLIVSERTGKKKKFQGLRRFLGVHN